VRHLYTREVLTLYRKRSVYTPIQKSRKPDTSRSSSLSSGDVRKKDSKKAAAAAAAAAAESTKRRATMNSRVAYDEDEMLRRAIEESNKEIGTLGKRSRDELDGYVSSHYRHEIDLICTRSRPGVKRQRTESSSPESARSLSPGAIEDGASGRTSTRGKQSLRGAAAKNSKEKELREKAREQQAAARAEAASKRNARSERRRGDGQLPSLRSSNIPAANKMHLDSPPPSPSVSPSKHAHRGKDANDNHTANTGKVAGKSKNARNARSGRRLGRNQYTRDRDLANGDGNTPMRDVGHDLNGNANGRGSPHHNGINGESGRSSKAKTHPARTSLNEMKRRVAAILEFVGQMQTQSSRQSASGKDTKSGSGSNSEKSTPVTGSLGVAGLIKAVQAATDLVAGDADGDDSSDATGNSNGLVAGKLKLRDETEFRAMGSTEMMESLTRELIAWQRVYGVYSR
jgi:hypothetical protein